MIKFQNKKFRTLGFRISSLFRISSSGFTLIELLVAVGVFSVAIALASGGIISIIRTQRQVASLVAATNNASLALEQMAREVRTGFLFCEPDADTLCSSSNELVFINAKNEKVSYYLSGDVLEKTVDGAPYKLTGENVSLKYLNFILFGNRIGDGWPPRITILLGVGGKEPSLAGNIIRLQTTVSARELDT